jgi:hypothetical protein
MNVAAAIAQLEQAIAERQQVARLSGLPLDRDVRYFPLVDEDGVPIAGLKVDHVNQRVVVETA